MLSDPIIGNYYIGIMSGTSLDGIDVAIAQRTRHGFVQIAAAAPALDNKLRQQILTICQDKKVELQTLGEVDFQFACACAHVVNQLLEDSRLSAAQIEAIGSHGQTIFHSPNGAFPFTQQIGDANLIAAKTGITCVADFRRMDMAYGGQGAPLVPAFHQALFAKSGENRVILNIGGIANITILESDNKVLGYDTGPGNTLMDAWCEKVNGECYDKNGEFAFQGEVLPALLKLLLSEPYFSQSPPKSTGREKFNLQWLAKRLAQLDSGLNSNADIQRTLLELSAVTISEQIQLHSAACAVFVCGGGALNPLLMQRLQALMPDYWVSDTAALNIDPMFVEAIAFAWLAEQRLLENTIPLKAVTGARRDALLGCVYRP
ncbi:anhydro-N-acetylmuramic acid kinase [Psychromonas ingrahamii 37]|uniref:Anhydro-N-acetylmuramic acid kinase n=1 Tax=Psychromonas ingrahamii (strain DSM 17664 / CCUG 51855 / 37) TaxID=357804 RepID=A1SRF8_PSYIN|nr:anhydro-N-acetylmuramic acid kinase [Psychromonas ingrahamii]ABM02073.1 anhydro-N-acetylmuramic acid kinase [Psychromonas ingrahamii 37]